MVGVREPCLSDGDEGITQGWSAEGWVTLDPTACTSILTALRFSPCGVGAKVQREGGGSEQAKRAPVSLSSFLLFIHNHILLI